MTVFASYPMLWGRGCVLAGVSWRFVILLSILAMISSLVVGGLAGVPLLLLLARVTMAGLVFAFLAIFVNMIFFRLFPEAYSGIEDFVENEDSGIQEKDEQDTGKYVNMVTPGNNDDILSYKTPSDSSDEFKSSSPAVEKKEADEIQGRFGQDSGAMAQAIKTVINRE